MPKLSASQLDAWADYWSRYFQDVLDRHRRRKAEECEAQRLSVERWRRLRALERGRK